MLQVLARGIIGQDGESHLRKHVLLYDLVHELYLLHAKRPKDSILTFWFIYRLFCWIFMAQHLTKHLNILIFWPLWCLLLGSTLSVPLESRS